MDTSRRSRAVVALASLALVFSCAGPSTTIEQTWRAPDVGSLHNVVTAYIARDGSVRRSTEDRMAATLSSKGIHAVPLYSVLGEQSLRSRDTARAALLAAGYDGIVAIRLVAKDTYKARNSFDDYWGAAWPALYEQTYVMEEVIVRVETNVYALANNRLVWSALSRTVDPRSTRMAVNEVTTLISGELAKGVVISSRP